MNFIDIKIAILGLFALLATASASCQMVNKGKNPLHLDTIHYSFLNMDTYLPSKTVHKSNQPFVFPKAKSIQLPASFNFKGKTCDTQEYLDASYTQGLLVIQDDTIRYHQYWRGQDENSQHISWSVSKSYISALLGIALHEGHIKSIEQTVDEYLPELKGSGYEGVKIKDVLQMSSGVGFDETYSNPQSDINLYWNGFMHGNSQDEFAATLKNERQPGTYNKYVSIDTHVLGMLIVRATGKSLTEYLEEKLWQPMGSQYDAYWLADGKGMEMALGGLNATLIDYAKLGRLYLNQGNWNGMQIVPASWVAVSTSATEEHLLPNSENSTDRGIGYGYQWWIPDGSEGEFMAIGVFNQHIYVNPATRTIIVKTAANKGYYEKNNPYASSLAHIELYRKIAHTNR